MFYLTQGAWALICLLGAAGVTATASGCSKKTASGEAPVAFAATSPPVVTGSSIPSSRTGRIAYQLPSRKSQLLEARDGARPIEIDGPLDKVSAGEDEAVYLARDGSYLALVTTRFGCSGWACLAVVRGDLSSGEKVEPGGKTVHPGEVAVSAGGVVVVYVEKGPHANDLFLTRRDGSGWTAPTLLTRGSNRQYNAQPTLSYDGTKVLFDCGDVPYGQEGTGICEVLANGSGFRTVLSPGSGWARGARALHHPDYAPDGAIVFEADRPGDGERIWRLPAGATDPVRLGNYSNDNSPCVLPNGKVVSLWLNRPGGPSTHEIKVMAADGSSNTMALKGADVLDAHMSCGN